MNPFRSSVHISLSLSLSLSVCLPLTFRLWYRIPLLSVYPSVDVRISFYSLELRQSLVSVACVAGEILLKPKSMDIFVQQTWQANWFFSSSHLWSIDSLDLGKRIDRDQEANTNIFLLSFQVTTWNSYIKICDSCRRWPLSYFWEHQSEAQEIRPSSSAISSFHWLSWESLYLLFSFSGKESKCWFLSRNSCRCGRWVK